MSVHHVHYRYRLSSVPVLPVAIFVLTQHEGAIHVTTPGVIGHIAGDLSISGPINTSPPVGRGVYRTCKSEYTYSGISKVIFAHLCISYISCEKRNIHTKHIFKGIVGNAYIRNTGGCSTWQVDRHCQRLTFAPSLL